MDDDPLLADIVGVLSVLRETGRTGDLADWCPWTEADKIEQALQGL